MRTKRLTTKKEIILLLSIFCICLDYISCTKDLDISNVIEDPNYVNTRSQKSTANYAVSLRDAINYVKATYPKKEFNIEPYILKGDSVLYIVNFREGWSVIAGDKRVDPIVAEDVKGSLKLDLGLLSPWISSNAEDILTLRNYEAVVSNENTKLWDIISPQKNVIKDTRSGEPDMKWAVISYVYCDQESYSIQIPHLLSTSWGQEAPWNTKCPIDIRNNKQCPTGCWSVAIAQLLYFTHYHLGKPNGLHHNISITNTTVSSSTNNIGYVESNYYPYSSRWDTMAHSFTDVSGDTVAVGDLMLEVGKHLGVEYSGYGSRANNPSGALSYFNIQYNSRSYNFNIIKNSLQNNLPIIITAQTSSPNSTGHAWIIDGLETRTRHYTIQKTFEYTDNWMHESEYYDSFDDLRRLYNLNDENDIIEVDGGTYTSDCLLMNWGFDGFYNGAHFGSSSAEIWSISDYDLVNNKIIYYDFR